MKGRVAPIGCDGDRKILALLIGLVIIRGIIYISIIPPWLAPDESTHFEAIRLIGQEGLWPATDVYGVTPMHPEMHPSFERFRIWQISGLAPPQGFLTPGNPSNDPYIYYYPAHNSGGVVVAEGYTLVYHLLLSPISALSRPFGIDQQLYLLRLTSLFFTTLVIIVGWFFARTIFPKSTIAGVALSSFLIFLPMHIHINTAVNPDGLTTLLVSLYFLILAKIFCGRVSFRWVALAGGILLAAVLIKPTALFIIPTSVVAVIIYLSRRFQWKPQFSASLLIATVAFTFLGAVLLFQFAEGGRSLVTLSFSIDAIDLSTDYFSQTSLGIYIRAVRWSFLSLWGLFGWANIPIPSSWARLLWIVCLAIGLGVVIFLVEHIINLRGKSSALSSYQKDVLFVLLLSLVFALISLYAPTIAMRTIKWNPQSRYFFPALLPFALYFFLGFRQLVPVRLNNLILPIWLTALIFFDTIAILFVLIPFIYG